MDKNSTIGFLLIGALLIGYIYYNQKSEQQYERIKATQDSIARVQKAGESAASYPIPGGNSVTGGFSRNSDSLALVGRIGSFAAAAVGTFADTTLENNLIKITFTNKGGEPIRVQLKKFKTYSGHPLLLEDGNQNQIDLEFPNANTLPVNTENLYFTPLINALPDGSKTLTYRLNTPKGSPYLEFIYTLHPNKYMMDLKVHLVGFDQVIPQGDQHLTLNWKSQALHQEMDFANEKQNAQVYYRFKNGDMDYFSLFKTKDKKLDTSLQWVSFKQHFFNVTFIAPQDFVSADIHEALPSADTGHVVATSAIALGIPFTRQSDFTFPMQVYFGPNDYNILKSFHMSLQNVIPLGYGIFIFVKYINIGFIIPLFTFLSKYVHNYGVIIIILTLLIRILLSPLTYKSYISAAKMKVLKPELDELRAKYKDDQQKFGTEQMKLYKTAGVSPLGGCLPTLLQLPILYAMYSFFPSSIELRQQGFLWCKDLSTYDSIWNFHVNIPLYGDHVSLFTILMATTSIILALYNKNMTDQSNPALKYMPYIFPVMLLGIFNHLAAALTFYYFLSNLISIILQWVIQRFIIDEKKIHLQIQANKKRPVKQSKWQQRLEEMQKNQQASGARKK
ncbi:MAG: membrane protein insertase YidC [Chitinophagaceae bacterium]